MEKTTSERLFFALWPEPRVRETLAELVRREVPSALGRRVRSNNLHITLAFLGDVGESARESLEEGAGALVTKPFSVTLRTLGQWRQSGVVWTIPNEIPVALARLAQDLAHLSEVHNLPVDAREFQPHVTLVRFAYTDFRSRAHDPIDWAVSEFCLVASDRGEGGVAYRILRRWPLG